MKAHGKQTSGENGNCKTRRENFALRSGQQQDRSWAHVTLKNLHRILPPKFLFFFFNAEEHHRQVSCSKHFNLRDGFSKIKVQQQVWRWYTFRQTHFLTPIYYIQIWLKCEEVEDQPVRLANKSIFFCIYLHKIEPYLLRCCSSFIYVIINCHSASFNFKF